VSEPGRSAKLAAKVATLRAEPGAELAAHDDEVALEEPLEIRLSGDPFVTVMRTPGHDRELALGFLFAEGVIRSRDDVGSAVHCGRPGQGAENVLDLGPGPGFAFDVEVEPERRRRALSSAACGLCGRAMIDDLVARLTPLDDDSSFERSFVTRLTSELRARQPAFDRTGALHAAGVALEGGTLELVREDVGRHNAVDKVVGRLLLDARLPARGAALVVSGRASFEIVQKAAMARIPAIVSVSAPSSLAVSTAARVGMLLVGFAREGRFNVYTGAERLR
jgi:FdhD protein